MSSSSSASPTVWITPEDVDEARVTTPVNFGPLGEQSFLRTYARDLPGGGREDWYQTMARVVNGNLNFVDPIYTSRQEALDLYHHLLTHQIVPGGRHLWATGVQMGNVAINNCHGADYTARFSEHFEHSFLRLMEGGGVGTNVSDRFINSRDSTPSTSGKAWKVLGKHEIHLVCSPNHKDYKRFVELEHEQDILARPYAFFVPNDPELGQISDTRTSFLDKYVVPFASLLSREFSYRSTPTDIPNVQFLQVEDSREGWAEVLVQVLDAYVTQKTAQKFVIDVSQIRAFGEPIRTFGGTASGPEAFMLLLKRIEALFSSKTGEVVTWRDFADIEHWIAVAVISGGSRRSARMMMKYWADPGIHEFINLKIPLETGHVPHHSTNISVVVDNKFFRRLEAGDAHAVSVAEAIVDGMLRNGEPGIVNASNHLKGEAPGAIFKITNPCSEVTFVSYPDLPCFEVCCIGHLNLAMLEDPMKAATLLTRFLIRATCAPVQDPRMKANIKRNRRIGAGILGYADWLVLNGIRYSESATHVGVRNTLYSMSQRIREEAVAYARDLRIVTPIKTTTIAPTGTVSMLSGVTSGMQPVFAKFFKRRVRFADGKDAEQIKKHRDAGYRVEPDIYNSNTSVVEYVTQSALFNRAINEALAQNEGWTLEQARQHVLNVFQDEADLEFTDVLAVQDMLQEVWADNSISVTANIRQGLSKDEVFEKVMYYAKRLKGLTLFPERSFHQPPLERITWEQYQELESSGYPIEVSQDEQSCKNGVCPIK